MGNQSALFSPGELSESPWRGRFSALRSLRVCGFVALPGLGRQGSKCAHNLPSRGRLLQTPHTSHLPHHARTVIMASSLATHQFAGVNAQFKCVRARRRRGEFRDHSLPAESAATRATFLPEGLTGTRAARPRAASPRALDSRDEWLTTPAPLFRRSAVARKNVKAARNVQVRNETRKNPLAFTEPRQCSKPTVQGSRAGNAPRRDARPSRRAANPARRSCDTPPPRASTAHPRRPPRAPPPRRAARLASRHPHAGFGRPRPGGTPAQKPD